MSTLANKRPGVALLPRISARAVPTVRSICRVCARNSLLVVRKYVQVPDNAVHVQVQREDGLRSAGNEHHAARTPPNRPSCRVKLSPGPHHGLGFAKHDLRSRHSGACGGRLGARTARYRSASWKPACAHRARSAAIDERAADLRPVRRWQRHIGHGSQDVYSVAPVQMKPRQGLARRPRIATTSACAVGSWLRST